jgi:hypothetical protein
MLDDKVIHFNCRNAVDKQRPLVSNGGLGLRLIKDRLSLLYPNKHKLALREEIDYFEVDLTVDTK